MIIVRADVTDQMLIFSDRPCGRSWLRTRPTAMEDKPVAAANSGHRSPTAIHRRPSLEPVRRRPALGGLINEYTRAGYKPWSKTGAEFWHPTGIGRQVGSPGAALGLRLNSPRGELLWNLGR